MAAKNAIIPPEHIVNRILLIRDQKVIIDSDLADLYDVTTKRLNEQVKRNIERFPADFVFQLTKDEKLEVVANCDHLVGLKFSRTNPYAFTEHGAIMAAGILNSPKAIEISVLVVRTFVKLRQILSTNTKLRYKLTELENRLDAHDGSIKTLINTLHQLMEPPGPSKKRPIGFAPWPEEKAAEKARKSKDNNKGTKEIQKELEPSPMQQKAPDQIDPNKELEKNKGETLKTPDNTGVEI